MAFSFPFLKLLLVLSVILSIEARYDHTSLDQLMIDALESPWTKSVQNEFGKVEEQDDGSERRSLFRRDMRYYISYEALAANWIPCKPRSGRSYYTNYCFGARGPANPYIRGCSRITYCRR